MILVSVAYEAAVLSIWYVIKEWPILNLILS